MKPLQRIKQSGQIVIVVGLSLIVLIGMVGLAIDSGRGYGVKAKLNSAVDAAAIAAARALTQGADDATRLANAQAAGLNYYNANFPAGYLGATPNPPTIAAVKNPDGYWQVTVDGSAVMPVTFLSVLGFTNVAVSATGVTIRRDVDVMLVMDSSGSLGPPYSPSSTFPNLKNAANTCFVNKFTSGPGGDRLGVVSFASGAVLDVPINKTATRGFDKTTVTNAINALTAVGSTAQAEGMRRALDDINAIDPSIRSSLRVIVFFSDGAPNDVSATFTRAGGPPVMGDLYSEISAGGAPNHVYRHDRRDADLPGTPFTIATLPALGLGGIPLASYNGRRTLTGTPVTNTRCNVNKAARNMVENIANHARNQDIYIYTVGLGSWLNTNEINFCSYGPAEYGANILNRLANSTTSDTRNTEQPTGLYLPASNIDEVCAAFATIASEILRLAR